MNTDKEPIIDADTVEDTAKEAAKKTTATKPSSAKPKKNIKFHLFLIFTLGVGTWLFWTFSPEAQRFKDVLVESNILSQPKLEQVTKEESDIGTYAEEDLVVPTPDIVPIFEPVEPALDPLENNSTNEQQTSTPVDNSAINESELAVALQELKQQMYDFEQNLHYMQNQQLQWSQQQVRAQLFALLQKAASPKSSLDDRIIAWKSIELLPLLSQDKRNAANQAFLDLQDVQQRIQQTTDAISNLIINLATPLQAKDLKEVAQEVGNVIDPYQQTDAFDSWLDWMKQQFTITKLDKHALDISDDPYAELKQLITTLNQLQQAITAHHWQNIGSLTALLYQLEQRGLEAPFSQESIAQLQRDINMWQQEAQTWMVQL